jgi:acyl-CoA reductase-like NAD-dependent aldehyde dehydrogenase
MAQGPKTIAVDNPATGAVIGHVPDLGAAEAEEAVAAAQAAFGPGRPGPPRNAAPCSSAGPR